MWVFVNGFTALALDLLLMENIVMDIMDGMDTMDKYPTSRLCVRLYSR